MSTLSQWNPIEENEAVFRLCSMYLFATTVLGLESVPRRSETKRVAESSGSSGRGAQNQESRVPSSPTMHRPCSSLQA